MKKIFLTVQCLILFIFCQSQNLTKLKSSFYGKQISFPQKSTSLENAFIDYDVFELNTELISMFLSEKGDKKKLNLKLGQEFDWELDLERVLITSASCNLTIAGIQGETYSPFLFINSFKGNISSDALASEVRLTVTEGFIYGYIQLRDKMFFIEPIQRFDNSYSDDLYIFYEVGNVKERQGNLCGSVAVSKKVEELNKNLSYDINSENFNDCKVVGISIAIDNSMFQSYGSVANALNYVIGVINNVNGIFDNEFEHEIVFIIGNLFVSTCVSCNPWTNSNDAEILLNDFKDWGNNGGFCGGTNDLHGLWTKRDLFVLDQGIPNNGVIGIAFTGTTCGNSGYQVIEDFNPNSAIQTRNLVAHEIGHNFNAPHNYEFDSSCNPPGRPTLIMDPSISSSNTWSNGTQTCSSNSIGTINNHVNGINCLSSCDELSMFTEVWVDFNYTNCIQFGTFDYPFNNLSHGVHFLTEGGTIKIKPSSTNETLIIQKESIISKVGTGSTIIGQ